MLLADADQSQDDVVHRRPEDTAFAFDVQAPAAILGVLAGEEVVLDLDPMGLWHWRVGDVPGHDQSWQQKHRSAIVAGPIPWRQLEMGEEVQSVSCRS